MRFYFKKFVTSILSLLSMFLVTQVQAGSLDDLLRLKLAYPEFIHSLSFQELIWLDGSLMNVDDERQDKTVQERLDSPSLLDQVKNIFYKAGIPEDKAHYKPSQDPGRIRYLPFFMKMYGDTEEKVRSKCTTIYWMPQVFADKFPLEVTTVNGVDQKLMQISIELENLVAIHPDYLPFLDSPGGTFSWRHIANTNRLSAHSFGMTIDINSDLSNYWQWDLKKEGKLISEDQPLNYRNDIPWEIVSIFERHGFIWGGKWHHYDSMHFEYRPELLIQ